MSFITIALSHHPCRADDAFIRESIIYLRVSLPFLIYLCCCSALAQLVLGTIFWNGPTSSSHSFYKVASTINTYMDYGLHKEVHVMYLNLLIIIKLYNSPLIFVVQARMGIYIGAYKLELVDKHCKKCKIEVTYEK